MIAGEPFLVDERYIAHFDGRNLYFNGYAVVRETATEAGLRDAVMETVAAFEPELVWYSGPLSLDRDELAPALRLRHRVTPAPDDVCMAIELAEWDFRLERHRRQRVRQAAKKGFDVVVKEGDVFTAEHIALIEAFVQRVRPGSFTRSMLGRLGDLARLSDVALINVFLGVRLVAFAVIEAWFESVDIFVYGFSDRREPGAGDYLQFAVTEASRERGKRALNLGYSITPGLRAFKEKWGGLPVTDGYWDELWTRREQDVREGYCHWPHRLLPAYGDR